MPAAKKPAKKKGTVVLTKAIEGVFSSPDEDDDRAITFQENDIGLEYDTSDPAVAKAVACYPDSFQ
jgi:hypothetical protein